MGYVFIFQVYLDIDFIIFLIKIILVKIEIKLRDMIYSVEFEIEIKLEVRVIWFFIFKGQKYFIVCKYLYSFYYI